MASLPFSFSAHAGELPEFARPLSLVTEPSASEEDDEDMVFVKGGCFQMGDVFGKGRKIEKPVHEVCVDDFHIGRHEVTQKRYREVMGADPSANKGCEECPVDNVSWKDAQEYIKRLNLKTGKDYRLPTEAEWEYAARSGGRKQKWAGTNSASELGEYAWYRRNAGKKTHPVGERKPNGLGLYDISGNVWEWVHDRLTKDYYKRSPKDNPRGPDRGRYRVLRGGAWNSRQVMLLSTARFWRNPAQRHSTFGFRCAMSK
jgi:formylglycine-generating enzyme required for sulfatase activity